MMKVIIIPFKLNFQLSSWSVLEAILAASSTAWLRQNVDLVLLITRLSWAVNPLVIRVVCDHQMPFPANIIHFFALFLCHAPT